MKDIGPKKMIKSESFVREPVDEITRKITCSNLRKVILTGGRGVGKSVVLHNIEDRTLGYHEQFIYTKFDSYGMNYDKYDEKFYEHYYELDMAFKLLEYIEDNYGLTYEKYFKKYEYLSDISAKTTYYMNNHIFTDKSIEEILKPHHLLKSHEITGQIKGELMKYLNIHNLGIMIDRFDWTNGRSELAQKALSKYFDLFDKSVITVDDKELLNKRKRKSLEEKECTFIDLDYSKDLDIVKRILKNRIKLYKAENLNMSFYLENILNDNDYNNLIKELDGNISLMIDALNTLTSWYWFNDGKISTNDINNSIEEQKIRQNEMDKLDAEPPKLYLLK